MTRESEQRETPHPETAGRWGSPRKRVGPFREGLSRAIPSARHCRSRPPSRPPTRAWLTPRPPESPTTTPNPNPDASRDPSRILPPSSSDCFPHLSQLTTFRPPSTYLPPPDSYARPADERRRPLLKAVNIQGVDRAAVGRVRILWVMISLLSPLSSTIRVRFQQRE